MPEIRCQSKKFGEVTDDAYGELRIVCPSKFCKLYGDEIVEHTFNLQKLNEDGTVRPVETKRFKKPKLEGNRK